MDWSKGDPLPEGVYHVGGSVSRPKLISHPDIPEPGIEGSVVLRAIIDPDGIPTEVSVVGPADDRLQQIAIDNVRQWRFTPAYKRAARLESALQRKDSPRISVNEKTGQPVAVVAAFEMHFGTRNEQNGSPTFKEIPQRGGSTPAS
jgi:TonB family protein